MAIASQSVLRPYLRLKARHLNHKNIEGHQLHIDSAYRRYNNPYSCAMAVQADN